MYAIRSYYVHIDFLEQLDGVEVHGGISTKFHRANGEVDFAPPVLKVTGKVRRAKPIQLADFEFLKSVTKATPKVTIPSPTMLHFRGGRAAISKEAYPDIDDFFADVAAAYREELKQLGDAGCTYVQLDDTNLAYLCDEKMREGARQRRITSYNVCYTKLLRAFPYTRLLEPTSLPVRSSMLPMYAV